jgi:hypothetical protein
MSRLSRTAVDGSLRIARLPLDMAITVLPTGRRSAKLAVDRADANVRALAATLLRDDRLRDDAEARYAAAAARQRSVDLQEEAGETAERADERVAERHHEAARRRRSAESGVRSRRKAAGEREQQRTQQAAKAKRRRVQASRQAQDAVEQVIEEKAPRARLEALDKAAEAQQKRGAALAEMDEAQRLREAAERVKEERKQS